MELDWGARRQLARFLREAGEAAGVARRIVEGYGPEEFMGSVEARYALRYALLLVVESLTDALTVVLERLGAAPESYRDAFMLACEYGVLPCRVAEVLAELAALRNIMVHRYWRVEDERIYRETRRNIGVVEEALRILWRLVGDVEDSGV